MKRLLFLLLLPLLVTGCTEARLGTHLFKKATYSGAPYSAPPVTGKRKIGNPYTINGVTYYPRPSSDGYRAKGIASWYGKDFHGKLTANGEVYNMYDMTAAHPTLPLPTWVRVTNLENGRTIRVRVNDRGPFLRGRLIDLSYRAASRLGMATQGTAPVLVEALPTDGSPLLTSPDQRIVMADEEEPTQGVAEERISFTERISQKRKEEQVETPVVAKSEKETVDPHLTREKKAAPVVHLKKVKVFVQTGAFSNRLNATNQKAQLEGIYPDRTLLMQTTKDGQILHRVRVGPIDNVAEADTVLANLVEAGYNTAIIVVE